MSLAAAQGQAVRALRLAGATATRDPQPVGVAHLRDRSGALPCAGLASFGQGRRRAAWEGGRALTLEGAIGEATSVTFGQVEVPAPKARPSLRIFALGPGWVERGEHVPASSDWTYAKPRELFFHLLCHPSRTREQIGLALARRLASSTQEQLPLYPAPPATGAR